jgi:FKBP-type peptidyl-prolyl cis-trans isomerase (trigger factor)
MYIGSEDPDLEARELFVNRSTTSSFFSEASLLQAYFRSFHDRQYNFELYVKHHAQSGYFNIDRFKQYFKLKTDKELHRKLVEVFSFRQDVSLRRETAEAALRVVLRYHPFHVPFQFVQQEAELLLEHICSNPDYYVYKSSPDFREKVQLLAQKRVKESALMDAVAYAENITVQEQDILDYLNLLKRPRTREFVYFTLPETRIQERETPLPHDTVAQICLREKTLNHIIQLLGRNSV